MLFKILQEEMVGFGKERILELKGYFILFLFSVLNIIFILFFLLNIIFNFNNF